MFRIFFNKKDTYVEDIISYGDCGALIDLKDELGDING